MEQNMIVIPMHSPLTGHYCATARMRRTDNYANVALRCGNAQRALMKELYLLTNNGARALHPHGTDAPLRGNDVPYGIAAMNGEGVCVCCGAVKGCEDAFAEAMARLRAQFVPFTQENITHTRAPLERDQHISSAANIPAQEAGTPPQPSFGKAIGALAREDAMIDAAEPAEDGGNAPPARHAAVLGKEPPVAACVAADGFASYLSAQTEKEAVIAHINGAGVNGAGVNKQAVTYPFHVPGDGFGSCPFEIAAHTPRELIPELFGGADLSAPNHISADIFTGMPITDDGAATSWRPIRPPRPKPQPQPQPQPQPEPQAQPQLQPGPQAQSQPEPQAQPQLQPGPQKVENPFPHQFPGSSWTRIQQHGGGFYLEGRMRCGNDDMIITAVPKEYSPVPPPHLRDFTRFIQARSGGYWVKLTRK